MAARMHLDSPIVETVGSDSEARELAEVLTDRGGHADVSTKWRSVFPDHA